MKLCVFGLIIAAIALLAAVPGAARAGPRIAIYTDNQSYRAGETIEVSLAGDNLGEGLSVDVYVGLLTPDGELWTVGAIVWWSEAINPWIESIYVPAGFTMNQKRFFSFDLPSGIPPIHVPGEYSFAAVLTEPGTFNWVCDASFAPFAVFSVGGVDYYVDAARGEDYEWYDGSEGLPWKTITHALNSVVASPATPATIHVAGGVYSASTNGETFPLNMKSWLSLVGEGADVTVLDAQRAANHVIYCYEAEGWTIEGLTITGGNGRLDCGGGICYKGVGRWWDNPSIISNNTIAGNSASDGGGIYCETGRLIITGNVISANGAWGGGGIWCEKGFVTIMNNTIEAHSVSGEGGGIHSYHTILEVYGNTIRGNAAEADGGGVYSCLGSIIIGNNAIEDNSARYGGGVFCWLGNAWIDNNRIEHNTAEMSGGGLCAFWTYISLMNNLIIENSSQYGGGIRCDYSDIISNNVIALNTASQDGGGVMCDYPPTLFCNNTISGNVAGGLGGGIYSDDYGDEFAPEIIDSIIWKNGDDLYNCTATYCCVQDPDEGEGNIHSDPLVVPGPFGDYYLDPQSPCIDAGSRSAEEAGLSRMTTQANGTPDTGTVDMGVHYQIPPDLDQNKPQTDR